MKVYLAKVTGKATEIFSTLKKAQEYVTVSPPAEIRIFEFEVDAPSADNGKVVEHMFID